MAPPPIDFRPLIKRFEAYRRHLTLHDVPFPREEATEVHRRLKHLQLLMERLGRCQEGLEEIRRSGQSDEGWTPPAGSYGRFRQLIDEAWIATETFYYFAFRIRSILQDRMPYLTGFECEEVRDVRVHLIEHPKELLHQSFHFDRNRGPILKVTPTSEPDADEGLYGNARQFRDDVTRHLQKVLEMRPEELRRRAKNTRNP